MRPRGTCISLVLVLGEPWHWINCTPILRAPIPVYSAAGPRPWRKDQRSILWIVNTTFDVKFHLSHAFPDLRSLQIDRWSRKVFITSSSGRVGRPNYALVSYFKVHKDVTALFSCKHTFPQVRFLYVFRFLTRQPCGRCPYCQFPKKVIMLVRTWALGKGIIVTATGRIGLVPRAVKGRWGPPDLT
jgi:hypothetical protein